MQLINGDWQSVWWVADNGSAHVYGYECGACGKCLDVNHGPYRNGESVVVEHECRALEQREGGRDDE